MMGRGVCADALNPTARPSVRVLKGLGCGLVRLVAVDAPELYSYDRALAKAGIQRAFVWTGTTFAGASDMATVARQIVGRLQPNAIHVIANEFDIDGAASWPAGGLDAFVAVWSWLAPVLPEPRYIGGLFDVVHALDTLGAIWERLEPKAAGVDLHPYTLSSGDLSGIVGQIRDRYGCAVSVGEWNDSVPAEIGPFESLLEDLTQWSSWIPISTEQLGGELPGLYRRGRLTVQGRAYRAALHS